MKERKYVKFRVDMYDDTKFKIIDMKPERDVIHYIWTRLVTLTGKVNCEGELYMSKNIPYTIETLAIEFNRDISQVKLALEVFIELEMVEINENNVYTVKNFAKHQNIKTKERIKLKDNEEEIHKDGVNTIQNTKDKIQLNNKKGSGVEEDINENRVKNNGSDNNRDTLDDDKNLGDKRIIINKNSSNLQNSIPIAIEKKKNKNADKNKGRGFNSDVIEEESDDNRLISIYDSDEGRTLEEGENVVSAWAF